MLPSFRWSHVFLVVVGVFFVATYLGLLSWGQVEQALERLTAGGAGGGVVKDRSEAQFVVFAFLFLTPVALIAGSFLLALVATVLGALVRLGTDPLGLPEWAPPVLVYGAIGIVAWAESPAWLPRARYVAELLASAVLLALH